MFVFVWGGGFGEFRKISRASAWISPFRRVTGRMAAPLSVRISSDFDDTYRRSLSLIRRMRYPHSPKVSSYLAEPRQVGRAPAVRPLAELANGQVFRAPVKLPLRSQQEIGCEIPPLQHYGLAGQRFRRFSEGRGDRGPRHFAEEPDRRRPHKAPEPTPAYRKRTPARPAAERGGEIRPFVHCMWRLLCIQRCIPLNRTVRLRMGHPSAPRAADF